MDFEKDLRLSRYLVRRYVKAYGELVLEHLEGSDVWNSLSVSHLFLRFPAIRVLLADRERASGPASLPPAAAILSFRSFSFL